MGFFGLRPSPPPSAIEFKGCRTSEYMKDARRHKTSEQKRCKIFFTDRSTKPTKAKGHISSNAVTKGCARLSVGQSMYRGVPIRPRPCWRRICPLISERFANGIIGSNNIGRCELITRISLRTIRNTRCYRSPICLRSTPVDAVPTIGCSLLF